MRSRKREELNYDTEVGHLSAALPHLANISYRTERSVVFDPTTERFRGDEEANRLLAANTATRSRCRNAEEPPTRSRSSPAVAVSGRARLYDFDNAVSQAVIE